MSAMGGKLTLTQVTFSDSFSAPMAALRYILYLAFAFSALAFWAFVAFGFLGFSFGDPSCSFEPGGCPEPSTVMQIFHLIVVYGAIPATVLLFVCYRRWVRRLLGMEGGF